MTKSFLAFPFGQTMHGVSKSAGVRQLFATSRRPLSQPLVLFTQPCAELAVVQGFSRKGLRVASVGLVASGFSDDVPEMTFGKAVETGLCCGLARRQRAILLLRPVSQIRLDG
jgi:hypothetical protein